jgi:hypothetical protein
MPYKIYSHLVLDPNNEDIFKAIVKAAKEALDDAQDGIILGTEYFDQIGKYAQHDGLGAMKKIVDALSPQIKPQDVTVVVNYRKPRFEQWESIWKDFVAGTSTTYDEFICTATEYHKKMELLSTAMNPLQIAQVSLEQGWNVDVIDMDGVEAAGMDVSHSIACDVLLGKCTDDGWAKNHVNDTIYNRESDEELVITELTEQEKNAAELLFQARDCAYRKNLTAHHNFHVVRRTSLWKECHGSGAAEKVYEQMLDVELIFRGLLSQMECPGNPVQYKNMPESIDEVLSGNYNPHHAKSGSSGGKGGRKFLFLLTVVGVAGAVFMAHKHPNEATELMSRVKVTVRNVGTSTLDAVQNLQPKKKHRHSQISGEAEMEAMPVKTTGMSGFV